MSSKLPLSAGDRPFWLLPGWRWMSSIRVGIVLLAVLAAASIGGTMIGPVVQDGKEIESAVEHAQKLVFYSWWYEILLVALAINIGCATVHNVVAKILPAGRPQFLRDQAWYRNAPARMEIACNYEMERIGQEFARQGFRFHRDGPWGHATRGLVGRWGAPIAHVGFIVVLLASFLAGVLNREGWVQISEGQEVNTYITRNSPPQEIPLGFALRCEDFDTDFFPHTSIPSHFITLLTVLINGKPPLTAPIEVNRSLAAGGWTFHQTSYQKVDGENRYRLAISREGQPVGTVELSAGQSRPIPGQAGFAIELGPTAPLRWTITQEASNGEPNAVQSGSIGGSPEALRIEAVRFEPDFVVLGKGQYGSRSAELRNPALQINLFEGQQKVLTQWLFGKPEMKAMMHGGNDAYDLELVDIQGEGDGRRFHVMIHDMATQQPLGAVDLGLGQSQVVAPQAPVAPAEPQAGPWQVKLAETVPMYVTVLTLTRNPILPVIYLGCAIMLAGLMLAFFIRTSEAYLWLDERRQRLFIVGKIRHGTGQIDKATRAALRTLDETIGGAST